MGPDVTAGQSGGRIDVGECGPVGVSFGDELFHRGREHGGVVNLLDQRFCLVFDDLPEMAGEQAARVEKRVPLADGLDFGGLPHVVAFAVRTETGGANHQHGRLTLMANSLNEIIDGREERRGAVIETGNREAEGFTPGWNASAQSSGGGRGLGDGVVLDDKQDRQLPDGGKVHAFVKQAFAKGAITDDAGHDAVLAAEFPGHRQSDSDGSHAGLDAIAVKVTIGEMLATANAAGHTALAAHDLGNQSQAITGVSEKVAMIAMVRKHRIAFVAESANHRHLTDFLADTRMGSTGKMSFGEQPEEEALHGANQVSEAINILRREANDGFACGVTNDP